MESPHRQPATNPARIDQAEARYEAVVFDNDGTITRPTDRSLYRRAVIDAFDAFGVDPPNADVSYIRSVDTVRQLCERHDIDVRRFWTEHEAAKSTVQIRALDAGDKSLYGDVDAVIDLPVSLGIVSNNQHRTIEYIVDTFDLDRAFDTWYGLEPSLEGLRRRKPDPHYLDRALEDVGTRNALYVGDSNDDIRAAAAAGVDSAFVERPHRADYELDVEPTFRFDDLEALAAFVARRSIE